MYRLASWNILCATCNPGPIVPSWLDRRDSVVDKIKTKNASVLALQEVQGGEQLAYMREQLSDYSALCVSDIDNSGAHTLFMIKIGIDYQCLPPIDIADNRQCLHILIGGVNYYNCHFPLTDRLNTESMDTFIDSVIEPFIFMGDFNTHSGSDGYPQNDEKLLQYVQTRSDVNGPDSFWNIDKIGTSDIDVSVRFNRKHDMSLSDHPYVQAKFFNPGALVIKSLFVNELL